MKRFEGMDTDDHHAPTLGDDLRDMARAGRHEQVTLKVVWLHRVSGNISITTIQSFSCPKMLT